MDGFKLGRLYKGEEYTITLPVPFSGEVDDFQFLLFTDSATTVEIPKAQITINDGVMEFTVQETDLDVLNDGVLNYYLKYTVGSTDKIQCTNTMHYLKSPSDYNPKTTQDIYNEGYEAGVEASSGDYSDGFADGEAMQKSKLISIDVNENGTYEREDGYGSVTVNIPQSGYTQEDLDNYFNMGKTAQKSLLVSTAFTENGIYSREDGYSMVEVNVPQTGGTYVSQSKNYSFTANGTTDITVDQGYDGITGGTINVNVPQTGHTDEELTQAYNSGYTAGETDGEVAGAAAQKALLVTTAITMNGTYTREDGYSTVEVDIAQSGHTDAEIEEAYESGYTQGYTSGNTDGYNDGYTSGSTDGYESGYTEGYTSGNTDGYDTGYSEGYSSGSTDGYGNGYSDGEYDQKAKLITTAITVNGVYSTEDGYSNVEVDVPQTGHTDQEVEEAYDSGYTQGYTSGTTDGYDDGFSDGHTSGMTDQKNLLVTTAITQNGVYTRENGYNEVTVNVPSSISNVMAEFPGSFGSWYDTSSFLHNSGQVLSIKFTLPDQQGRLIYSSTDEYYKGGITISYYNYHNANRIECDFDDENTFSFTLSGYTFPLECVLTLMYKKGEYVIGKLTTNDDEQVVIDNSSATFTFDSSLMGFCLNNGCEYYVYSQSGLVIDYLRLYDIDSNGDKTMTHNFEFDGANFVDLLNSGIVTTNYEIVNGGRVRTDTVPSSVTKTYIADNMYLTQSKTINLTVSANTTETITPDSPYDAITGGSINVTVTQPTQTYPDYSMYFEGGLDDEVIYSGSSCTVVYTWISSGQTKRNFFTLTNVDIDHPCDTLAQNYSTTAIIKDGVVYFKSTIGVSGATGMTFFQPPTCISIVDDNTFSGYTNLVFIEGLTFKNIGSNAFRECTSLRQFGFGSNIETIGDYAFKDCSSLFKIYITCTNPPTFGTGVFENLPANGTLKYKIGCDYSSWLSVLPNGWTAVQE